MKHQCLSLTLALLASGCAGKSPDPAPGQAQSGYAAEPSLQIEGLEARYEPSLDAVILDLSVAADAASLVPEAAGQVDGAPVLGYVFTTDLSPRDVGFDAVDGLVALAVTSHPDFDDTPLWDEDDNDRYDDDGAVYHSHWVVLQPDARAPAGLAVAQSTQASVLPPTAPMPMYLDSPGFTVLEDAEHLRVLVPADRIRRKVGLRVGAQTAFMRVDASGQAPLLAVHEVVSTYDGGGPTSEVANAAAAPTAAWPSAADDSGTLDLVDARAAYIASVDTFVFTIEVAGTAAALVPAPAGQVDGAPVVGYVFPTDLDPSTVGFRGIAGTLALAVTVHPDFDDTPLWDEDLDGAYDDDGATYHVHWVTLVADSGSPAGLSVPSQTDADLLPPTAPMPMYLDSPGYHAFASGSEVHVLVPGWHLGARRNFNFDAVTARMRVDASGSAPALRVEEVVEILSTDLSLPLSPTHRDAP